MEERFTAEELALAKTVDLTAVAASLGYTVKRIGNYYTLKEMDSIRIYNRTNWFRWSRQYDKGENGGSQIDFLRVFEGMEVKEAVFWLLDFAGYQRTDRLQSADEIKKHKIVQIQKHQEKEEKKPFVLPEPSYDNAYLYWYLHKKRGISMEVIDLFVSCNLIYESRHYHNVVFKGNDKNGITRFASMRGVFDENGKTFKCDVAGNDKHYGFNLVNEKSRNLVVLEAAIDLMSYMDIFQDFTSNMLALGMLHDAPLETFLKEHPDIRTITFSLDNDKPGRTALDELKRKYEAKGYIVLEKRPPDGYKDMNEWMVNSKKKQQKNDEKVPENEVYSNLYSKNRKL